MLSQSERVHPGGVVMFLVASCWVSCDGLASHPGGVVMLLVASCWVPCDGLAFYPEGVVISLVASSAGYPVMD